MTILYFITNIICFNSKAINRQMDKSEYGILNYLHGSCDKSVVKQSIIDGVLLYNYELK